MKIRGSGAYSALACVCMLGMVMGCGTTPDPPAGSGTVAGSFDGRAFDHVAASYRIGAPDDPKRTMVFYVFDQAVGCNELAETGWDEAVADKTQALEMKIIGTVTGDYPVAKGPSLSEGEASVNYTLTSTSGTPLEVSASGGSVTIEDASGDAGRGRFALTFPSGDELTGTFTTAPCAEGHEP